MKKNLIAACALMLAGASELSAQSLSVKGTVLDDEGLPVIGATVKVKNSKIATVTDMDGHFTLKNLDASAKRLVISYIGMVTEEVAVKPQLKIVLESNEKLMDEVMVVAYGTAKKASFTGSAEVVDAEKLKDRPVANVTKALEGSVSGVQMTSGTGQPGEGVKMVIRGFGSINAETEPLCVVDGIPFDGDIASINPSDIENITVLKDASAGALYGARGANGVVMVTTKRGSSGKAKVSLKANWGFASRAIPEYETLDQAGFLEAAFQHYKNLYHFGNDVPLDQAGILAIQSMKNELLGPNEMYNPFDMPIAQLIDPATGRVNPQAKSRYNESWMDEATAAHPLRQEYVLTVTGGTDKVKSMFSFGYLDEKGLLKTTQFKRFSGRANVDAQITDWFKSGLGLNYARNESNFSQTDDALASNVWFSAQFMAPIYPVYEKDAQGHTIYSKDGKPVFDYGPYRPSGANANWNMIATLYDDKNKDNSDNLSGRAYATLGDMDKGVLKGLSFTTNFGFDLVNAAQLTYQNPYNGNAVAIGGIAMHENTRTFSYTWNQMLTYKRSFGKHSIDLLAGHEFYLYHKDYLTASRSGFPYGGIYDLDAAVTLAGAGSYQDDYAIQSFLGRANYNYADKYYLSASFRTDASSRFAKDNRWGQFWSVGGNWRISHEQFMEDVDWVDNLSLKLSYGKQGNDNVGSYYAWQKLYKFHHNAGHGGVVTDRLGNEDLTWEKNGNVNVGLEARLFDRLGIGIEWYNRKTTDMLMYFPLPVSSGFDSYDDNVGSMRNRGVDITLNVDVFKSKDLYWRLGWMGSTISNKVLHLADKPEIISATSIIKEGEPLNSFYLATSAGVDPKTGEQLYWVWDEDENGNRTYRKTNSGAEANSCRSIQGSRIPKIYGSVTSDFSYKNFDFSMIFTYSIGGKILDNVYTDMLYSTYIGRARHADLAHAWKQEGDITDIPRIDYTQNHIYTDKDLINASYFSMKNITLGYTLPGKWTKKAGLESVRLTAAADNVFMLTHLKGMNPQNNFTGTTSFTYVPVRTVTFGVDVKF